tara:strand:- start:1818 stop:2048 length:231 start_codon:yes stop_codon:yes gene_type:complete
MYSPAEDIWDKRGKEVSDGIHKCARCGVSNMNPHPYDGDYGFQVFLDKGKYHNRTLCWICRDNTLRESQKTRKKGG